MIKLANITQVFQDGQSSVTVLDDFSQIIEKGSITVIVGPSGCGKTTLLNIMGGLLHPTSGRLLFDELDYYSLSARQQAIFRSQNIGYVFQDFYLIDDFSPVDNVLLSMNTVAQSKSQKRETAKELLSLLGLSERIQWNTRNLSGGEKQRVAIARALANKRSIILCDEPTGNLDEESAAGIIDVLLSLKRSGNTVVMVTHNMRHAEIADDLIDLSR